MSNNLKKDEKKEEPKQGKPWSVAGKYQTYDEAALIKEQLEEAVTRGDVTPVKQYKIKRMRSPEHFVIKSRIDPDAKEEKQKTSKKKRSKKSETDKAKKPRRAKKEHKDNGKKR